MRHACALHETATQACYGCDLHGSVQVTFVNGMAIFHLQSIHLHTALHDKILGILSTAHKLHKTFDDIKTDLSLLPKSESRLCHDCVKDN